MKFKRVQRIIRLIGLLQAGRGQNVKSLSELCGVCKRTIFRDLDTLRQADVPLKYDAKQQRFHIPGTYFLPPTNFTAEEAVAVMVLCHELGGDSALPFYSAAHSAAIKLENVLPSNLRGYMRSISASVRIKLDKTNLLQGQQRIYDHLVDAIARKECVRISYESYYEDKTISTRLSPYQLMFNLRSWYVIGRSTLHRSVRMFNVGRIKKIEQLEIAYKTPRGFNIERYLKNAWRMIPEKGPDQKVLIRFSKLVARNVAEVNWHKNQRTVFNQDGSLDFHVRVSGLSEITWWILGYGDQAVVIQPPKLRKKVAERVRNMHRLYQKKI